MLVRVISPDGLTIIASNEGISIALANYNIYYATKTSSTSWKIIQNMSGRPNQGIEYKAPMSNTSIPMFTVECFYNIPGNKVACPYRVF